MSNIIKYPLVLLCVCTAAGLALAATFALTHDTIREKEYDKEIRAIISAFWDVETPKGAQWNDYDGKTVNGDTIYVGYRDSERTQLLGYVARGEAEGYSGPIRMMVGARPVGDGNYEILGVKIISQQETPGLGARVNTVFTTDTLWSVLGSLLSGNNKAPAERPELSHAADALGVPSAEFPERPAFQRQFAGRKVTVTGGRARGISLSTTGWERVSAGENPQEGQIAAMTGATVSSRAALAAVYDAVEKIDKAVKAGL